jgi:hypothetical protein
VPFRAAVLVWEIGFGTRVDHVPYVVEQDEDGVWCASAQLRPGVGAVGDGPTPGRKQRLPACGMRWKRCSPRSVLRMS